MITDCYQWAIVRLLHIWFQVLLSCEWYWAAAWPFMAGFQSLSAVRQEMEGQWRPDRDKGCCPLNDPGTCRFSSCPPCTSGALKWIVALMPIIMWVYYPSPLRDQLCIEVFHHLFSGAHFSQILTPLQVTHKTLSMRTCPVTFQSNNITIQTIHEPGEDTKTVASCTYFQCWVTSILSNWNPGSSHHRYIYSLDSFHYVQTDQKSWKPLPTEK